MEPRLEAAGRTSGRLYPLTVAAVVLVALSGLAYLAVSRHMFRPKIASNEAAAIVFLKAYLSAQNMFRRADHYGIGKNVYANTRDGVGLPDLYAVGGPGSGGAEIKLIDLTLARATPGGGTKAGYQFTEITADSDGPYDPETECGLCAVPVKYSRSGRCMFIIDVKGTVYQKDAPSVHAGLRTGDGELPVTVWPDVAKEGWLEVD